jgi:predicted amidohydrolase
MTYKLGMGQIKVEGGKPRENLRRALAMVEHAAQRGCRLVVLPECLNISWTWPELDLACPIPGEQSALLGDAARRFGICLAAGLVEKTSEGCFNAAVLISPEGQILLKHRKINLLDIEQPFYGCGTSLSVARTPLGTIGLNICADNFPDSLALGHSLARMGAQLIVSPCAWAVDADHDNSREPYGGLWERAYTKLAALYDVTVVGVSYVGKVTAGPWQGRKCIGSSLAVGPGGSVLARGSYGDQAEELIVVSVTPAPPIARGADFPATLKDRGYEGP